VHLQKKYLFLFPLFFCVFTFGCAQNQETGRRESVQTAVQTKEYHGKIIQKLNRSQIIKIQVTEKENGRSKIIDLPFNLRTKGLEYAVKGKQVIVIGKVTGDKNKIVSIEPDGTGYADGVTGISVRDLKKIMLTKKEFVLIDTRTIREYETSHLPTAVSIPACTRDKSRTLSSIDKDVPLVFYCGWPDCGRSIALSAFAADAGYQDIFVLKKGLQGWAKAGYETIADDTFIRSGNLVLLNLRPAREDTVRRIPGSISIPLPTLAGRIDDIPAGAPVAVYGDTAQNSLKALALLRKTGFGQAAMVEGNVTGWQKRGNRVTNGPVVTTIHWSRKQKKGEVSAIDFKVAQRDENNAIILDVRTHKEVALGKIDHSIHIPFDELYKRMDELPKNKIIYCAAGPRADIASRELKKNGYTSLFLSSEIVCDGKKCEIKKE